MKQEAEHCPKCGRKTWRCFIDPNLGMVGKCSWKACAFVMEYEDDEVW